MNARHVVLGSIGGILFGVGAAVVALPAWDAACVSADTRLIDAVCPPSAVAIRTSLLRRETSGRGASLSATASLPAVAPEQARAELRRRQQEIAILQQRVAQRAPGDPARAGELQQIGQRIGELRSLPYGGQAAADEALGTMSSVMPELASDPVFRAGMRVGGVALDAGQAVDHAIGPNIDRAAARLEGALSRWRPRQ